MVHDLTVILRIDLRTPFLDIKNGGYMTHTYQITLSMAFITLIGCAPIDSNQEMPQAELDFQSQTLLLEGEDPIMDPVLEPQSEFCSDALDCAPSQPAFCHGDQDCGPGRICMESFLRITENAYGENTFEGPCPPRGEVLSQGRMCHEFSYEDRDNDAAEFDGAESDGNAHEYETISGHTFTAAGRCVRF